MDPVTPKVSLVIPAFNAEGYLERAVRSLLAQTLRELEIIVVNDASTDGTASLARRLQGDDPRVRFIDLPKNRGVQFTRSHGASVARAPRIGFVDADDWMAPQACEKLLAAAERHDADVVVCGARKTAGPGRLGAHKIRISNQRVYREDILGRYCRLGFGAGVFWNKLYRTDLIVPAMVRTQEAGLVVGEDYLVNLDVFSRARTVACLKDDLYFYYENPASLTRETSRAKALVRVLRAYAVAKEVHRGAGDAMQAGIDELYLRQLRLRSYHPTREDFEVHRADFVAVMGELLAHDPYSAYRLLHTFNLRRDGGEPGLRDSLRETTQGLGSLYRAFAGRKKGAS